MKTFLKKSEMVDNGLEIRKIQHLKKKRGCYSEVTASICIAETMGFEPMCRLPDNLISSQARYGHFDTSPVPIYYTMVLMEFQILFHKYFTNTEKGN